jgi:putative membrane protein
MKTNIFTTAILAGTLALASFASCNNETESVKTDSDTTKLGTQSASDVAQDQNDDKVADRMENDADFCVAAAAANVHEINAHRAAISQGTNAQVKSNAKHMLADHEAMGKAMTAYAQKKGYKLPTEPDNNKKQMEADVMAKTGAEFDKAWAAAQVKDHEEVVDLFEDNLDKRQDPELNAMIKENLPKLQMHLQMSRELNDKLK